MKVKPVVSPRTNVPPKNKVQTYNGNDQIIAEVKSSHLYAEKPQHLPPKPHPRSHLSDYLNTPPEMNDRRDIEPMMTAEMSPRSGSPMDYENGPSNLPTYEKAVSGDNKNQINVYLHIHYRIIVSLSVFFVKQPFSPEKWT